MSSSKGNVKRTRPQKYQNKSAFKNDLHDTSKKTKIIKSLQVSGVCIRCKEIIEWKIKYKKYKPLTAPTKCVGCEQKTVKHAYHVLCSRCSMEKAVCAKCNKPFSEYHDADIDQINNDNESEIHTLLKGVPERRRRTVLRYIKKLKNNEQVVTITDVEMLMADLDTFTLNENLDSSSDHEC